MNDPIRLEDLLSHAGGSSQRASSFALLRLGLVESLASGALSPTAAVRYFFYADNCLYVRGHLKKKAADELMSRGVQLPDLFEALSPEQSQIEFQRELAAMRSLCLKLLASRQAAA
jgi:hypothetical protein